MFGVRAVHGNAFGRGEIHADLRRIIQPDFVFDDLGFESSFAEFLRDVLGCGFVFGRSGNVGRLR